MEYLAIGLGILSLIGIVIIWSGQNSAQDDIDEIKAALASLQLAAGQHEFSVQRVITRVNKIPVPERTDMVEEDFMPDGDRLRR
jgi:hypothetical protein